VDRIPKSPRGSIRGASSQAGSPPDNPLRRSIFESGSEPRKEPEPEHFAFKPSINPRSEEIMASKGENPNTPIYDKLYQKKNDRERRRKRAQEEQLTKEMADCTFQPNVNERRKLQQQQQQQATPMAASMRDQYEDPNTNIVQRAESW